MSEIRRYPLHYEWLLIAQSGHWLDVLSMLITNKHNTRNHSYVCQILIVFLRLISFIFKPQNTPKPYWGGER